MQRFLNIFHPFLMLFFFMMPAILSGQTGTIKGKVFNLKNNEPVPFVNIIVESIPTLGATSDISGNYILTGVTPGFVRIVASSVGFKKYVSEEVMVTKSHPSFIDIALDEEVINLDDVVVKPSAIVRREESPVSMQTLSIREIETSPGANRDISRVIQSLPGVASSVAFRNDVIVRGGGPSENRFYLDGIEIPYINHFATQGASGGPVGIINTDFLREVELYSGAFQARRGNALSSVLEMRLIDGNREKFGGRFTIGASDLGLTLNGPITKNSSVIFSVRRSYLQFLFGLLGLPFLPTYNDYQLKYKIDINRKNQLTLISLGSLDNNKLNTGISNPTEDQRFILGYLPEYKQWSYAIGLVYRHFREKGYGTWVASRNMLNNEEIKYMNNVELPDSLIRNYRSQEIENKFRYENFLEYGNWKVGFGAGLEYAKYNNETFQKTFLRDSLLTLNYSSTLDLFKWSLFGQVTKPFFNDKLTLSLGIRMDANNYSDLMNNLLTQTSPRFSASWNFTGNWFLNFNTGRYFQLPAYTTLGYRDNKGDLVNDSLGLKYISADHFVLGLEWLPKQTAKLSLEGFYKLYRDYPLSLFDSVSLASKGSGYDVYGNEPVVPISKGRAYGFEVFIRDSDFYKFNVLISYTFVRSEFTNWSGAYFPSAWDNRHLLNVTLGRKFKYNWSVGMRYRFVGGTPYTPYDEYTSSLVNAWDAQGRGYFDYDRFNTLRLQSTNQLDIRIDKGFFFRKWSFMLYVDVQNVLGLKFDQPDALVNTQPDGSTIKYIDDKGNERYQLRYIPSTAGTILPTVGIILDI